MVYLEKILNDLLTSPLNAESLEIQDKIGEFTIDALKELGKEADERLSSIREKMEEGSGKGGKAGKEKEGKGKEAENEEAQKLVRVIAIVKEQIRIIKKSKDEVDELTKLPAESIKDKIKAYSIEDLKNLMSGAYNELDAVLNKKDSDIDTEETHLEDEIKKEAEKISLLIVLLKEQILILKDKEKKESKEGKENKGETQGEGKEEKERKDEVKEDTSKKGEAGNIGKDKEIPLILKQFLDENFPGIDNIHSKNKQNITPLELALKNNNLELIKIMFEIDNIDNYCDKEDYVIANNLYNTDDKILQYLLEKILKEAKNNKEKVFARLVNAAAGKTNVEKKEALKLKKIIEFLKSHEDEFNILKDLRSSEVIFQIMDYGNASSQHFLPFLTRKHFYAVDKDVQNNIPKIIAAAFFQYGFAVYRITSSPTIAPLDTEEATISTPSIVEPDKTEDLKAVSEFRLFLLQILKNIPPGCYDAVHEALETTLSTSPTFSYEKLLTKANYEVVKYLLEYRIIPPDEVIAKVISEKNKPFIELFKQYIDPIKMDSIELNVAMGIPVSSGIPGLLSLEPVSPLDLQPLSPVSPLGLVPLEPLTPLKPLKPLSSLPKKKETKIKDREPFEAPQLEGTLDDMLFGHIHNDHALLGTRLQGGVVANTMIYLNKFIDQFKSKKYPIKGLTPEKEQSYLKSLSKIQERLKDCLEISKELINYAMDNNPIREIKSSEEIIESIVEQAYASLLTKEGGLIPGGWIGLNNTTGHAMLYEFKKKEDGSYVLLIHNTGGGIQYHMKKEGERAQYYSSVKAYDIPAKDLLLFKDQLKSLLTTMIKPNIIPSYGIESYNEKKLYEELDETAAKIGLQEVDGTKYCKEWTRGQSSGTCSWRAFRSYLKNFPFEEGMSYDELSYEVKKASLEEYLQAQSSRLTVASVQRQINFAIQNLARHLEHLTEKKLISEERLQEGLKLIQDTREKLLSAQPERKQDEKKEQVSDLPQYITESRMAVQTQQEPQPEMIRPEMSFALKSWETESRTLSSRQLGIAKAPLQEIPSFEKSDPLKSLREMLQICKKNYEAGQFASVYEVIERCYLQVPLDDTELWKNQSRETLQEAMELIKGLNSFCSRSIAKQSIVPFADQAVTLCSGQIFGSMIANEYYKDKEAIRNRLLSGSENWNTYHQLSSLINAPQFITCHPKLQERIEFIAGKINEFEIKGRIATNKAHHIHLIINQEPWAKKILDLFNNDKKFKNKLEDDYPSSENPNIPDEILISYYYLRNIEKLAVQFPELSNELKIVMNLENIVAENELYAQGKLDSLIGTDPSFSSIEMFYKQHYNYITKDETGLYSININPNLNRDYKSRMITPLEDSQPKIEDPTVADCLKTKIYTSNQIQTESGTGILSESIALRRALLNTRIDKRTQITATIDIMKKEFLRLQDPSIANFVFDNLFYDNLLINQIKDTPEMIDELKGLIERSFKTFIKNKQLKPPAFFFLKLSQFLEYTMAHSDTIEYAKEIEKIRALNEIIPKEIAHYEENIKKKPTDYDKDCLKRLQSLNLIRLKNISLEKKELNDSDVEEILSAIFYIKNVAKIAVEDPFIEHYAIKSKTELNSFVQKYLAKLKETSKENYDKLINKLLDKLKAVVNIQLPKEEYYFEGQYPEIQLRLKENNRLLYTLNLDSGEIFQQNISIQALPPAIYNNPLYKEFFTEKVVLAKVSADQTVYEFTIKGINYRFITNPKDKAMHPNGLLQKEIEFQGIKKWYQYYPDINKIKTDYTFVEEFPLRFQEQGTKIWFEIKEDGKNDRTTNLVMDEKNQKILSVLEIRTERKQQFMGLFETSTPKATIYEIDSQGAKTGFQWINTSLNLNTNKYRPPIQMSEDFIKRYPQFTAFENIKFIEFWKKERDYLSDEIIIKLPRYGLEFRQIIQRDGTLGDIIWEKDKRYRLKLDALESIGNFKSAFHLEPIPLKKDEIETKEKQEDLDEILLVPKQQFIATDRPEGEFYELVFDTRGHIQDTILERQAYYTTRELDELSLKKISNSESYSTYKVTPALALEPKNINDRLYLTYLYLAKRQPLLAFNTLKEVLKTPITLDAEQLEMLRRIMLEIPVRLKGLEYEVKIEDDARLHTPEVKAVRALAASILAEQKLKQVKIDFNESEEPESRLRLGNRDYEKVKSKKLKIFWEDQVLTQELNQIFDDYYKHRTKVPEGMRIGDRREQIILKQLMKYPSRVSGPLKYRKRELDLKDNYLEKQRLEQWKAEHGGKLPKMLQERLDILTLRIESYPKVKLYESESVEKTVPITTEPIINFNYPSEFLLLAENTMAFKAYKVPLSRLSFSTEEHNFIYSFQDYYNAAKAGLSKEEGEQIKLTLEGILYPGLVQKDKDKKATLTFKQNLAAILRYVIEYPDLFPKGPITADNIQHCVDIIQSIVKNQKAIPIDIEYIVEKEAVVSVQVKVQAESREPFKFEKSLKTTVSDTLETKTREKFSTSEISSVPPSPILLERKDFLESFQKLLTQYQSEGGKEKLAGIQSTKEMAPLTATLYDEIQDDYQAGVGQNLSTLARNKAAKEFFEGLKDRGADLLKTLKDSIETQNKKIEELKKEIIDLANKPPTDPRKLSEWNLQKEALQRSDLNFEQILRLFLSQDKNFYRSQTALSDDDIDKLNQKIHNFLLTATQNQQNERISAELTKLQDPKASPEKQSGAINQLGTLLYAERCFDPVEEPEILLFEYLDNKLLFPLQHAYLKDLLTKKEGEFQSQEVQLIMGGGKSKVLMPLLALKKTTGINLSIVVVPDALFQINRADLGATTQKIFGQEAIDFYFDDTVKCDVDYLSNLRKRLRGAMLNRQYIITTPESMKAFELQYIKFLKLMDPTQEDNLKKARLFAEITRMFKYQGDAFVDEFDSAMEVRKQLIYMVGRGEAVPNHELQAVIDFHLFFDKVTITLEITKDGKKEIISEKVNLKQILLGEKVPSQHEWPKIFKQLAHDLINHPDSPLQGILKKISEQDKVHTDKPELFEEHKTVLLKYLLGEEKKIPDFLQSLNAEEKDQIALYKEEITSVLPLTLKKNVEEHFGLSKDTDKSDIERETAIPFLASNTPNEKSKFGNYLETINYTLRIQLYKPLSKAVIRAMIERFKAQDEEDLKLYFGKLPDGYKGAAERFRELTTELDDSMKMDLDSIDLDNPDSLEDAYQRLKSLDKVKQYCLLNHILNTIEKNTEVLASDAQNFASQFHTIQGMTGTDWNYRTYPGSIQVNKKVSKGSDGQTRHHLLRDPQPVHLLKEAAANKEQRLQMMEALFHNYPKNKQHTLHAWIDLGAYFKGISNKEVAEALASFFIKESEIKETEMTESEGFKKFKYILYFGPDDKLYALSIKDKHIVPLEKTDPDYIVQQLGCSPSETFTYYDQRRITGTDIKQDADTHAFVPIGLRTLDRDLLQAVMRLRELRNEQRVEFVVPKEVQDAYPNITDWNVNTVMKLCIDNQVARLAEDHYRSALQKMRNQVRNNLLDKLLSTLDVSVQKKWIDHFDKVFFSVSTKSAFEQFGGVRELETTEKVLREFETNLLTQWKDMLKEARIKVTDEEMKEFTQQLSDIVTSSVNICAKEVEKAVDAFETSLADTEVEVEKEEETEKAEELEQETDQRLQERAEPHPTQSLSEMDFMHFSMTEGAKIGGMSIESLESMAASGTKIATTEHRIDKRNWKFSDNIFVSQDFSHSIKEQANLVDAFKKDGVFVLVEQDDKANTIKFLMVTPEQAAHIAEELRHSEKPPDKHYWIETVHNVPKFGKKPEKLHPNYQKGIEEMAFFNADTDILFSGLTKDSWLKDYPDEKMQYLERVLRPLHKDKVDMMIPLKRRAEITLEMPKESVLTHFKAKGEKAKEGRKPKQKPSATPEM